MGLFDEIIKGSSYTFPTGKKKLKVYIVEKRHDINGNPVYTAFIPDLSGKVKGLRKLKKAHHYSFSSYNVHHHLREYALKDYEVELEEL